MIQTLRKRRPIEGTGFVLAEAMGVMRVRESRMGPEPLVQSNSRSIIIGRSTSSDL